MESKVFYTDARARYKRNLYDKLEIIIKKSEILNCIEKDDLVAIKIHAGEAGNTTFLQPFFVGKIVEMINEKRGKPFITDTTTLYVHKRHNAVDYSISAIKHGFSFATVGAPFIVADGLTGDNYSTVKIDCEILKEVHIASNIINADSLIVLTHFKGHETTGFGGAIKNVGMGCASKGGKFHQHSGVTPKIIEEKCTGCSLCINRCSFNAISLIKKIAVIDDKKCTGCGDCISVCKFSAIKSKWATTANEFQKKMTEYAYGVLKAKKTKIGFVNFLINITPDCDCCDWSDVSIVPDLGILVSKDIVAIDKASVDLVNNAPINPLGKLKDKEKSKDKFFDLNKVNWRVQLEHGQKIGLGNMNYKLIKID
jgi:hypothetical protein